MQLYDYILRTFTLIQAKNFVYFSIKTFYLFIYFYILTFQNTRHQIIYFILHYITLKYQIFMIF